MRWIRAGLIAAVLWPTAAKAQDLDVRAWLERPGVRMVAVEFYATWCKPCMNAVPKWKALHEKYREQGLRLIVVATQDPEGQCVNPGWNPDEIVCDPDGQIARAMSVGNRLPAAFVWTWQRNLLVRRGHVDEVERAIDDYMRRTPRAVVRSKDKQLMALLRSELSRAGKIQIASSEEERKTLRALKRQGLDSGFNEKMACDVGKELPPNSVLDASITGGGNKRRIALTLLSVETGCVVAAATSPWSAKQPTKSVAEALDKVVGKLQTTLQLPSGPSAHVPEPKTPSGPSFEGGEITSATGRLRVEGRPRGARVEVSGPGGYKRVVAMPQSIENLEPGPYVIEVSANDHVTAKLEASVEPDLTATVQVRLDKPGELHVDGEPRGASVEIFAPNGSSLVKKSFPMIGRGLDPGTYAVAVSRSGYKSYRQEHIVRAGQVTRVRVTLEHDSPVATFGSGGSNAVDLTGQWLDKESSTLFTIERVRTGYRVVTAIDQNDNEVYPITSSKWKDGVLRFEYDVPSTGYHLEFESTLLTDNEIHTKWKNASNSGAEVLYRQGDAPKSVPQPSVSRGIDLGGQWLDRESSTLFTIERSGAGYRVVKALDQNDDEVFPIAHSKWTDGVLRFAYDVPSTGYHVEFVTTRLTNEEIHTEWKNASSSGTEILYRQGDAPAPPPTSRPSGDISGQWEDKSTEVVFTIVRKGSGYEMTKIVDDDGEEFRVTRFSYRRGRLEFAYYVPSSKTTVKWASKSVSDDRIICTWDNGDANGTEPLVRIR